MKPKCYIVSKRINSVGGIQNIVKTISAMPWERMSVDTFSFSNRSAGFSQRLIDLYSDFKQLLERHREPDCRAFIYTITGFEVIVFSLLTLFLKKDLLFWEHGDPRFLNRSRSYRILFKYLYPKAKRVIVLHEKFKQGDGIRYAVIPNPAPPLRASLVHAERGTRRVIWVGRVSEEKQPKKAYEAMLNAAKRMPDVAFFYIHTPHADQGREDLPANFSLIDGKSYDFRKWLNSDCIVLLTSSMEAMPGVLFEAIASGCRVITTSCSPWISDLATDLELNVVSPDISAVELSELLVEQLSMAATVPFGEYAQVIDSLSTVRIEKLWVRSVLS
jgi:glycosyltransferase involved in cell wall biosynthesis